MAIVPSLHLPVGVNGNQVVLGITGNILSEMSPDQDTIDLLSAYYAKLLIIQYRNKERAKKTITSIAELAMVNLLPTKIRDAFNIDDAEGEQLDFLGKYAGALRIDYGSIAEDDEVYRLIIKMLIMKNNAKSDLSSMQDLMIIFFGEGTAKLYDYQTMRISYMFDITKISRSFLEVIIANKLLLVPMGVQLSATIFTVDDDKLFGLRDYTSAGVDISGLNTYAVYTIPSPLLTYDKTIS